eukprot:g3068.t1
MVDIKFVRSSGPGGQNVNKLSTKAEVRLNIDNAPFPAEVKARLVEQQSTRINKSNELVMQSDAQRTQNRNLRDCLKKLQTAVDEAYVEPKSREKWNEGQGEESKKRRRRQKEHRKEIKAGRRGPSGRDFW